jgi:glycosyltransferase involved in cell wall biosynthesis
LLEAGHDVHLVTCSVDPDLPADEGTKVRNGVEKLTYDGFEYESFIHRHLPTQIWYLQELLHLKDFDAVVGVNAYPAELLYHTGTRLPAWFDLNGWGMAEAQARAAGHDSDDDLLPRWRQEKAAVLRGDRFSTVSRAQRAALYGELASVGRLTAANFGTELIHSVPNAVAPPHQSVGEERMQHGKPLAPPVGSDVPEGAPIVLWSGGVNFWTDPDQVAAIFSGVLKQHENAHVVVTGGAIQGYGEEVYEQFEKAVAASDVKDRIHLMGWLPAPEMLAWYKAAWVGVNVDRPSLETEFGARNRLTNMAGSGLAVVSTRGAEVATDLEAAEAGWFVEPSDTDAFVAALNTALENADECFARDKKAFDFATTAYKDAHTIQSLIEWANEPYGAPDLDAKRQQPEERDNPVGWLLDPNNSQQRETLALHESLEGLRYEAECLRRLRNKWPLRLWRRLRGQR